MLQSCVLLLATLVFGENRAATPCQSLPRRRVSSRPAGCVLHKQVTHVLPSPTSATDSRRERYVQAIAEMVAGLTQVSLSRTVPRARTVAPQPCPRKQAYDNKKPLNFSKFKLDIARKYKLETTPRVRGRVFPHRHTSALPPSSLLARSTDGGHHCGHPA